MLKPVNVALAFLASLVLGLSIATNQAKADESFKSAPNPLDMMEMMSGYLGGEVTSQQLFDLGVEANMRVPMEHLRVRFVDTRSGAEMSRSEIDQILGQARQDWSYDLIRRTFATLSFPNIDSEQIIDLFNASALASMRVPPDYVAIEYYDVRLGAKNEQKGGVSGSIPDALAD